ncbi:MAG: HigA family addiction module antitoxin [Tepidanaerobacteraceae bacterium]|nr:HigA family addiction module antitoxin [Tepidanaerobacteraceae bacterium]
MVNKKVNNGFLPTIAIPPGETIRENMEFLGMNQEELAVRLGITPKHLSNIINGNAPITYETALKLESVIGPSAQFWMNLEANYQLNKARLEKREEMYSDLEVLKKIPYKKMSDLGWIEDSPDKVKRVMNCREFFGVANLSIVKTSYAVMFRKQKQKREISDLSVLAWLRKAELEGLPVKVQRFNRRKLRALIPTFRSLTMEDPSCFYPKMKDLCAECGIALVLVESLPKTYICGATIWRNNKAILALSVRGKRADIFWFTFFHELAHLLNHSKKEFHINYENNTEEDEANKMASNFLIPNRLYKKFLDEFPYRDKKCIVDYSHEINISPCILVGRLLYDKLIDYKYYSDLRPSFEIVREPAVRTN